MLENVKIGVIGGSGLYNMPEITDKVKISVETPFGRPSADVVIGTLRGKRVAFIPRHGEGHVYTPSDVPYRANIYALKQLGVRFCIAVNACGSLQEEFAPGHIVIPDQLYDNTKGERGGRSFFEHGLVGHTSVADPFSATLSQQLYQATQSVDGVTAHLGGTFVIIEGPRFSTRGESEIFRRLGCSIIGMTTTPEVFLAREAEIAYATIAHITDYDVWHQSEAPVTADAVTAQMLKNIDNVQEVVARTIAELDADAADPAHTALDDAIVTAPEAMSHPLLDALSPILARRFASR